MNSLLGDLTLWDLVLDATGDIAVASDPYSVAQDVASAILVYLGEEWYDTTAGVPYAQSILGKSPSLAWVKTQLSAAASVVPGCNNPVVYFTSFVNRQLAGQVQFTDNNGVIQVVGFGTVTTQAAGTGGTVNVTVNVIYNPVWAP